MEKKIPNGVIQEPLLEEDWQLGQSDLGKEILVENGDWTPYLPTNEKQRRGFESMACTNFSSTSTIETYFTYLIEKGKISVGNAQWLEDNGYFDSKGNINFSDRFDAIISGTTSSGNSLKNPAKAKSKYGLIPDKMLPWTDERTSYFDKKSVNQEMCIMGAEFLKRFPINYERVARKDFEEALKYSPLAGAVYAWNGTTNGVYHRVSNKINHAICLIVPLWKIMDSYDPFIKTLAKDYIFLNYAYRYIITENVVNEPNKEDMLKTIKANSDPRIFIQSNTDSKKLIWINDPDGSSWSDYQNLIAEGFVPKQPWIIEDSLLASYKIESWAIKGDYFVDPSINPYGLWQKFTNWLKKKWN